MDAKFVTDRRTEWEESNAIDRIDVSVKMENVSAANSGRIGVLTEIMTDMFLACRAKDIYMKSGADPDEDVSITRIAYDSDFNCYVKATIVDPEDGEFSSWYEVTSSFTEAFKTNGSYEGWIFDSYLKEARIDENRFIAIFKV